MFRVSTCTWLMHLDAYLYVYMWNLWSIRFLCVSVGDRGHHRHEPDQKDDSLTRKTSLQKCSPLWRGKATKRPHPVKSIEWCKDPRTGKNSKQRKVQEKRKLSALVYCDQEIQCVVHLCLFILIVCLFLFENNLWYIFYFHFSFFILEISLLNPYPTVCDYLRTIHHSKFCTQTRPILIDKQLDVLVEKH